MTDASTLPAELMALLDGSLPDSHLHQAIHLSSVGEDGWPYAAQLSLGEIVARSHGELLFAIWPDSTTTRNLKRDGKITLALVLDGAVLEIQARAALHADALTALKLAVFRADVQQVRFHRAPYATVLSGLTFCLQDEAAAIARWREQIGALKALA
ncbi:pyridoxamine 5'-phosphate oxidase family protein [Erwinia pyrifoliae]|uniref:Pyridoxamine 5'-phosphate oxidase family protein n=1 Tax=Erwinia pyrifoliae TaxID=79967 RepID=A0ABY5X5X3_ERWPY|nr:pyridoxamine 5'-phosphate oxidase family protein [Erwinia pyrifoliae]AUX72039.1 pyridoxamine 5-phosphate oxidase [Erwinia pyrifoliae]MCA8877720.1 pyridoxamine 5-phosphate oxidase [Erwinia pyrifoliae]UWS30348.1 pyridoxamine 5'-phosphate oxidase family protein [Erwinia pyrifoliae]UWS32434.1 pyridoxamine 5'-phosphate oxidase family protein [Erwinia pyrifoliae]UXK13357.1 pyridoxamine 5'-phosphate oxidase family protein [Erwinia pyrifoliae]